MNVNVNVNANANANAINGSLPVPISVNVNAIKLVKDFDGLSQIGNQKRHFPVRYDIPHI